MIGVVRTQFPHVLKFTEDIKDVPQAARSKCDFDQYMILLLTLSLVMASITDIVQEYTDMRQGLKQLGIELDAHWRGKGIDFKRDRFYAVMTEFRNSVMERFEEIEALYVNMDVKWKNVMIYYGENPQTMRPDEFLDIFARFLSNWKTCALEELKYAERKEREERRLQELEERRLRSLQSAKDMDMAQEQQCEEGLLVDDLLAKLRSGESLTKTRKSRVRKKNMKRPESSFKARFSVSSATSSLRRNSTSTINSLMPISAEDLLRTLQQDEE